MTTTTIRLTVEDRELIGRLAEQANRSVSGMLHHLIRTEAARSLRDVVETHEVDGLTARLVILDEVIAQLMELREL